MACEKCADLCLQYEIQSPSDLRKAIAVVRDNLADGTIREEFGSQSYLEAAEALAEGGPWPNEPLLCSFFCRTCGERFALGADYEIGSGGWSQTSAVRDGKERIIGDVPPLPYDPLAPLTIPEWLKQHRIGLLLAAGLIALSALLFAYLRY